MGMNLLQFTSIHIIAIVKGNNCLFKILNGLANNISICFLNEYLLHI